jgi:hypothetical protein
LGLGEWHSGDVACPSKKPTNILFFEGLNRKAFKEAGRLNKVENFVSDGNAAHGSSA